MGAGILDSLALIQRELPDPNSLQYAYGNSSFLESTSDKAASLTERELFYHAWNESLFESNDLDLMENLKSNSLSQKAMDLKAAMGNDERTILEELDRTCN